MNKKQAQTEAENLLYTSVAEAKSSLECARSNGRPYSREVLQIVLDRARATFGARTLKKLIERELRLLEKGK